MTVHQLSHEPMTASVFTVWLKTIANHILYRELMQNTTKDISFIFLFNKYSHMHASDMIMFPLYDDTGIFYLFGLPIYIYICFDKNQKKNDQKKKDQKKTKENKDDRRKYRDVRDMQWKKKDELTWGGFVDLGHMWILFKRQLKKGPKSTDRIFQWIISHTN